MCERKLAELEAQQKYSLRYVLDCAHVVPCSAGQSASPLSHQGSETVNFRQPRLSADSTCLMRSAPQSWGMTELDSRQDLGQNQGTRSQPIVSDRGLLSGKIGHTVSTGVTLPPLLHSASQKVGL